MPASPGDSTLPDWALDHARAALRLGLSVPEVEQRLVAKGLAPSTATAVVNAILEGHLQATSEPSGSSEDAATAHRAASAVVACMCLGLAYAFGGGESVGRTVLWLLLPVACIWWAEVFEANSPTLVRWTAWAVLLLIGMYRTVLLTP
jgi:hypothetical protein